MSTKIEWCTDTRNPVVGCSHCSPGCDHCYAERRAAILAKNPNPKISAKYAGVVDEHGKWTGKLSALDLSCFANLPKKPKRVFVGSMTDLFHINNSFSNLRILFAAMLAQPQHTFILLTKRHDRMWSFMDDHRNLAAPNICLNVTVCNQKEADEKIPVLLQTPAAKRGVSIEPTLGAVDLREWLWEPTGHFRNHDGKRQLELVRTRNLDWVICGGETGPGARPMHPDWARSLRDQCVAAGVPFFFKGWGGKRHSGRLLDGREWNEVPV